MHEPRVAIITPTYNHAPFLRQCIESAWNQTISSWEMVVIDDGSTDDTRAILADVDDPRIQVIVRPHGGLDRLAEAYAAGLAASSAPVVAILEGDDTWPPEKLERQLDDFEDRSVVLSYGAIALIDEAGCQYGSAGPRQATPTIENRPPGKIIPSLAVTNFIAAVTVLVRRESLERIGGFVQPPGVPYVDHATWLRLAPLGEFRYHPETVGCWRRHSSQYTTASVMSRPPDLSYARDALAAIGMPDTVEDANRRARERFALNRFRQVLLHGSASEVVGHASRLIMTKRPRLMGAGVLGAASWAVGGDLEWVLRRQRKVSWPSRRHLRSHSR